MARDLAQPDRTPTRRAAAAAALLVSLLTSPPIASGAMAQSARTAETSGPALVATGADVLVRSGFAPLAGKRVALIANHTALAGGRHLADMMHAASGVALAAILAPEHGFRGTTEAGAKVADGIDRSTGVPVFSLYGATRKPTPGMLAGIDVVVFDIQDIGARFYTYISTMGLAMQAAAAAGLPFVVLDRPNPLGGHYVSGFVLEAALGSFVGQYPIPIVHGLTVGELARMIQGERYLPGLEELELHVVVMKGWRRDMRWPGTGLAWVPTSPNIPAFASAFAYPGIGILGELALNEGRGTDLPFTRFGASWLDAPAMARDLNGLGLKGVRFEAITYTPRAVVGVAANPRFKDRPISGIRLDVTDIATFEPLEAGMHALSLVARQAKAKRIPGLYPDTAMLHRIAGTRRLHRMLASGAGGSAIIAAWRSEVDRFKIRRAKYLLY